jgi:xanthomonalisin
MVNAYAAYSGVSLRGTYSTAKADFTVATSGLTANFTDASSGGIVSHAWTFGDGATSTATNPSHASATTGRARSGPQ